MAQYNIVFYPSEIAACIGENYYKPRDVMLAQYLQRYSPCRAQLRDLIEEHERVRSAVQNAMYSMPADQASQVANELLTVIQEEVLPEPTPVHAPEQKEPEPEPESKQEEVKEEKTPEQKEPELKQEEVKEEKMPEQKEPELKQEEVKEEKTPEPESEQEEEQEEQSVMPAMERAREVLQQTTIDREEIEIIVSSARNQTNGTRKETDAYALFLSSTNGKYEIVSRHARYRGEDSYVYFRENYGTGSPFLISNMDSLQFFPQGPVFKFCIHAEVDGIVREVLNGRQHVLEIKTRQNKLFRSTPAYEAIQVRTYHHILDEAGEHKMCGGLLFQWLPATGECRTSRVECDGSKWFKICTGLGHFMHDLYQLMNKSVEEQKTFVAKQVKFF